MIGVRDDAQANAGFKAFVYLDDRLAFISRDNFVRQGQQWIDIDVTGVKEMKWIIDPLQSNSYDYIVFGNPVLRGAQCFGIFANETNACTGNGTCVGPDIVSEKSTF